MPASPGLDTGASLPPDINRGHEYLITQWVSISFAIVLVAIRVFTRRVMLKRTQWGDYIIIDYTVSIALACALAQSIIATFQVKEGFGRNIQYLELEAIQKISQYITATIFLYLAGTYFMRITVCLFILQLLPFTEKKYRRSTYTLMTFFTIITLATSLTFGLECIPLRTAWDRREAGRCLSADATDRIGTFQGVLSIIMDVVCVILPIPFIQKIQIAWRSKLGLIFVLALGLFTAVAAGLRLGLFHAASFNFTWNLIPTAMFACLEQNVGIVAGCMPSLQQLSVVIRRKRHIRHSSSVQQQLCEDGTNRRKPSIARPQDSPLTNSTAYNPSPTSTAFSSAEVEVKYEMEPVKNWSPRMIDAPRLARPSLTPEQTDAIKEYHEGKSEERKASCMEWKPDPDSPKKWSPRMIEAPRFEGPSLTPDQAQAIKEYHMGTNIQEKTTSGGRRYSEIVIKDWSQQQPGTTSQSEPQSPTTNSQSQSTPPSPQTPKFASQPSSPTSRRFSEFSAKNWTPRAPGMRSSRRQSLAAGLASTIKEERGNSSGGGTGEETPSPSSAPAPAPAPAAERKYSWVDRHFNEAASAGVGGKKWSPRIIDAPRFDRPSLTPEQARGIREYHMDMAEAEKEVRKGSVVGVGTGVGVGDGVGLGERRGVGYECRIEGGSGVERVEG